MDDENQYNIPENYELIESNLRKLFKKLYRKLRSNGLYLSTNDYKGFTKLIDNIGRIPANERYYESNVKPIDNNVYEAGDGISCKRYNIQLAQNLNFYMRLMGYYLALKGVPIEDINNALTLESRIDLIDQIDKLILTIFIVSAPEQNYYGRPLKIDYVLKGIDNKEITDGRIRVFYNDIELANIEVGDPLIINPVEVGRNNYIFEFSENRKYQATRVTKNIQILNPNVTNVVFLDNTPSLIDANGDLNFNYITANTNENKDVIVDMDILIDENDEAWLTYYTKSMPIDLYTLEEGLINIDLYAGDLNCEFVALKTLDN